MEDKIISRHKEMFLGKQVWPTEITFSDGFKLALPDSYMMDKRSPVDTVKVKILKVPRSYKGDFKPGDLVYMAHFLDKGDTFLSLDKDIFWFPFSLIAAKVKS